MSGADAAKKVRQPALAVMTSGAHLTWRRRVRLISKAGVRRRTGNRRQENTRLSAGRVRSNMSKSIVTVPSEPERSPASSRATELLRAKPSAILNNVGAVLRARWYLRGATSLGARVRVWGRPVVNNHGQMIIRDRVRLVSTVATLELSAGAGATLEIGEGTFVNYGCSIAATKLVSIGAGCSIGTHVIIIDTDFHELDPERRDQRPPSRPVVLEDNVWIGARAIILRGVTIGAGSAVGAGSVVTRNIPPRSLAVGQPARVIRRL
jgi:maltose O-acetyltransferase